MKNYNRNQMLPPETLEKTTQEAEVMFNLEVKLKGETVSSRVNRGNPKG